MVYMGGVINKKSIMNVGCLCIPQQDIHMFMHTAARNKNKGGDNYVPGRPIGLRTVWPTHSREILLIDLPKIIYFCE